jgi:hypothetical protein
MERKFKFELGQMVTETSTGYRGIVLHRTERLNGPNTYGVQAKVLHEGPQVPDRCIWEGDLELS